MLRIGTGPSTRAVGKLPRDEESPFAADLHTVKALIEAGNNPAESLHEADRLGIGEFGLAIVSHHRLAILIAERLPMVFR